MVKRITSLLLVSAMALALMAACNRSEDALSSADTQVEASGSDNVAVVNTGPDVDAVAAPSATADAVLFRSVLRLIPPFVSVSCALPSDDCLPGFLFFRFGSLPIAHLAR